MTGELLTEKLEKLESFFLNIMYLKPEDSLFKPNLTNINDIKNALNNIFEDSKCIDVSFTNNTDKPFFGIKINPGMSPKDAIIILTTDEKVKLVNYNIEFDSKLFQNGLDVKELAALTVYEISSIMDSFEIFDKVRDVVDEKLVTMDDVISIRDSVNYAQLIIFAIKDTMYKLGSFLFKENDSELVLNPVINAADYQDYILSAINKIKSSTSALSDSIRLANTTILDWMLIMYKDMKINTRIVSDTLTDAKAFTGSKLEIAEIDKCISAVNKINSTIMLGENTNLNKFFEAKNISSLNEISIFKSLKRNGLRSIEDDYYELAMRAKSCSNADDAALVMRAINNRLGILEDYLYNEEMKESERKHWEGVAYKYRELRAIMAKKKYKEKQFSVYIDYESLPSDNDNKPLSDD